MGDVRVRQVPDWVIESHRQHARRDRISLEERLRQVITTSATAGKGAFLAAARNCREALAQEVGQVESSASVVRSMREEEG